jgi:hypothetical protein
MPRFVLLAPLLALAAPALAQTSSINATSKFSWSENCGWMNWRDAGNPAASQGVRLAATHLSGSIWAENIGWINVGDGTPGGAGPVYTNTSGADAGVNIDTGTGNLSGFAWGENVGWLCFSAAAPLGNLFAARIDWPSSRLRGYIWGENIGWINLADPDHFIGLGCYANCDGSSAAPILNVNDFTCFMNHYAAANAYANCDGSTVPPIVNVLDFVCFQTKFAVGCP